MLRLDVTVPASLSDAVVEALSAEPTIIALSINRGAALKPVGDVITADLPRETANDILDRLLELGVEDDGTVRLTRVETWVSRSALEAEKLAPGAGSDAVVWADVTQRAYDDTELNWTMVTFMILATLLAAIAIVLDSQILTVGAMVLGPEFGAIAALGLALVRHRRSLFNRAVRSLFIGFFIAIAVTTVASLLARALGWVELSDVNSHRTATAFIYRPDKWSFIVAVIAAAAGVLSLTSSKLGGLSGVFISVTTIPAAGNVALGLAFGAWDELFGSFLQLVINIGAMTVAGWLTLSIQQWLSPRVARRRSRRASPRADWYRDLSSLWRGSQ